MDNSPSILSHVSIGTNDFERAIAFYDTVLPTLGCKRLMEHPRAIASLHGYVLAYGKQIPNFGWELHSTGNLQRLVMVLTLALSLPLKKPSTPSMKQH